MKLSAARTMTVATLLATALALTACSTDQAIDTSVGFAAGTTKIVAKGTVGAGKLAYKGGKKIVGAGE